MMVRPEDTDAGDSDNYKFATTTTTTTYFDKIVIIVYNKRMHIDEWEWMR